MDRMWGWGWVHLNPIRTWGYCWDAAPGQVNEPEGEGWGVSIPGPHQYVMTLLDR